jgi:hypothetical protein
VAGWRRRRESLSSPLASARRFRFQFRIRSITPAWVGCHVSSALFAVFRPFAPSKIMQRPSRCTHTVSNLATSVMTSTTQRRGSFR